jgi:dihydropteroate synthase
VDDRLAGTIASCVIAYEHGARVFRVHEVGPVSDALKVAAATVAPWTTRPTSSTM